MGKLKHVMIMLGALSLGLLTYTSACSPDPNPKEQIEEKKGGDGGLNTEIVSQTDKQTPQDKSAVEKESGIPEEVVEAPPTGPIDITFTPADGATIGVDGKATCIAVQFSIKPCSKGKKATFLRDGASVGIPVGFDFDPKDRTKATICSLGVLRQGAKYTLSVEVSENVKSCLDKGKKYSKSASYTTKAPYKDDKPASVGLGINLKLEKISKPAGVSDLLGGNADKIPPILVMLHSRDKGNAGNLVFVGGLGKAPPGGKPHQGKDVIDTTNTPVSLALIGKFNGRAFYVGPTTFLLAVSGFPLRLDDFSLTGIFTKDGKNVEFAKLTGLIDPALIEKQFGLNICQLLAGECFKGPNGKDRLLLAGSIVGVPNPFPFSAFITTPVYLATDFDPTAKVIFYTSEETKEADLAFTLSSCKGSSDEAKPCDAGKGAVIAPISGAGKIELNANKKQGLYTPSKLESGTWYKLALEAKNAKGIAFKTYSIFKTK